MNKRIVSLLCFVLAILMLVSSCGEAAVDPTTASTATTVTTTQATTSTATTATTKITTKPTTATTKKTEATTTAFKPVVPEITPYDGTLTDAELRDKVLGGWIGQMAGVALFASQNLAGRAK